MLLTLVAAAQTGGSSDWFASAASPAFRAMPPPLSGRCRRATWARLFGRQAVATDLNRARRTPASI